MHGEARMPDNIMPVMRTIHFILAAAVVSAIQAKFCKYSFVSLRASAPGAEGALHSRLWSSVQVKHLQGQRLVNKLVLECNIIICGMDDEKEPLRPPAMQIAVSRTPVEIPDRSLLRVFPKWLKVAKLWFQRK